jgi:hypothetical protein
MKSVSCGLSSEWCCLKNHDAFGCAEAGNIRVNFVVFAAGIHQKHAITGDLQACASRELLQVGSELGMLICKRFELVEEGIDNNGFKNENTQNNGQRRKPEVEPPAARTLFDDQEKNESHQREKCEFNQYRLGPIQEPRAPKLN